jgi:hypothetical protein
MAKIASSRFIVEMAAAPGQRLNNENFWFMVTDQMHQKHTALYYFGNVEKPLPQPTAWSTTVPPYTMTPEPLGVAEWGGTAIFSETNENYVVRTKIFISPDVLKGRLFWFEVHAHLNQPQSGTFRSSFSAPFRLRQVSRDVEQSHITELMSVFRPKILNLVVPRGR